MRRVARIDGEQHLGTARDTDDAEHGDGHEPQQHDRAEGAAHDRRSAVLDGEQSDQDRDRHRQHIGLEDRGADIEPFQRAEHRDRRGDDAVAIDQRGAEQPHDHVGAAGTGAAGANRRHEREDAALAVIVGAHHQHAILDRDRDHERPEDQRQAAEGRLGIEPSAERLGDRLQRVERAGAEIAVDDAERGQRRRGRQRLRGARGFRRLGRVVGHGALIQGELCQIRNHEKSSWHCVGWRTKRRLGR
jgi:hypothetical protein